METAEEIRCKWWDNGPIAESKVKSDCVEYGEIEEEGKVGLGWIRVG